MLFEWGKYNEWDKWAHPRVEETPAGNSWQKQGAQWQLLTGISSGSVFFYILITFLYIVDSKT
jgi:hypothetical protein